MAQQHTLHLHGYILLQLLLPVTNVMIIIVKQQMNRKHTLNGFIFQMEDFSRILCNLQEYYKEPKHKYIYEQRSNTGKKFIILERVTRFKFYLVLFLSIYSLFPLRLDCLLHSDDVSIAILPIYYINSKTLPVKLKR